MKRDDHAEIIRLHYLRTKEHKEIDFALVKDDEIVQAIEVKITEENLTNAVLWFRKNYQFPILQIVKNLKPSYTKQAIDIVNLETYLQDLAL